MSRARTPSRPAADARQRGTRRSGRGLKSCLAVLVALAVVVGGFYFAVTKGVELISDRFSSSAEDFPGPGTGKVDLPGPGGRHHRRDGPWAEEEGRRRLRRRLHRGRRRQPGLDRHPGRLLPAEEEDAGRRRPRGARRPGQHRPEHGHDPRGAAAHRDPRRCSPTRPTSPGGLRARCSSEPGSIGLPAYADGNAEGYLFPSTYDFGPKETPTSILSTMVGALATGRRRGRAGGRRGRARLRAGRGDDRGQPGRGRGRPRRGPRQGRAGDLQPARGRRDQRAAPGGRLGELRAGPEARRRPDDRAAAAGHAVQHLHATGAAADPDRGAR